MRALATSLAVALALGACAPATRSVPERAPEPRHGTSLHMPRDLVPFVVGAALFVYAWIRSHPHD